MLEKDKIDLYLKDLKNCQSSHSTTSCDFCSSANSCQKKVEFENIVKQYLLDQSKSISDCQITKNVNSCLSCDMVLSCKIRENYVNSVYLSMNRGNGGSFEF